MKKFQLIDLVRTFCIMAVWSGHLDPVLQKPRSGWTLWLWEHFQRNSMYGVFLFFGVSGYLITRVIAKGEGGLFNHSLRRFYVHRAGRILPLWLITVWIGICMVLTPHLSSAAYLDVFHPQTGPLSPLFWLSILTFTFNWFMAFYPAIGSSLFWVVLWSLSVEEQFYLFFPLALKFLKDEKRLYHFLIGLIVLCLAWRTGCYFWFPAQRFLQICTFFGAIDSIVVGILLYMVEERTRSFADRNPLQLFAVGGLGLVTLLTVYLNASFDSRELIFTPLLLNLGLALFLWGGLRMKFFASAWLSPFCLPGRYCYGGYLLHALVLSVVFPVIYQMGSWQGFGVFSLVTTLVAGLSYHFFEIPANQAIRSRLG